VVHQSVHQWDRESAGVYGSPREMGDALQENAGACGSLREGARTATNQKVGGSNPSGDTT